MTALYSLSTPLTRNTLARAEKVNEQFQAIADGFAYLGDASKWLDHRPNYVADAGAVNAYIVTLDPVPSAYRVGMTIDMVAGIVNTGASTINVNALGVKSILDANGSAVVAGAIPANRVTTLVYDGAAFRTLGAAATTVPAAGSVTPSSLASPLFEMAAGLSASWNPATDDTTTLGTATHRWGGAFFKSLGVINWNNGNYTITHSPGSLAFSGAATFGGAITPSANDGAALGSATVSWADLFLASGAVLNFNNGNYTVTHSAGALTFSGGASWGAALLPTTDDGAALGSTTKEWSDVFLATGAVINYANGNFTLTHSSGTLTASGAVTVNGAFTSLGIDDNATGERLQIADTGINFGPSSTADYSLGRVLDTGSLSIGGSAAAATAGGAILTLWGASHATQAGDILLTTNGAANSPGLTLDISAQLLTLGAAGGRIYMPDSLRIGQDTTTSPGAGNNTTGAGLTAGGALSLSASAQTLSVNVTSDGILAVLRSGGTNQGTISVSGTTITYGTFFGSHWSQLANGFGDTELLRGSIAETVDEMCVFLALSYTDHLGVEIKDEDSVPDGAKIGDVIDFTYETKEEFSETWFEEIEVPVTQMVDQEFDAIEIEGAKARVVRKTRRVEVPVFDEYKMIDADGLAIREVDEQGRTTRRHRIHRVQRVRKIKQECGKQWSETVKKTVKATVIELENDQLPRFKISDTPGSERPYGVYAWRDGKEHFIGSLGAYVVRIASGITVKGGDLIESNGDGCGRVMDENDPTLTPIKVRKRHVATVTANIIIPIYWGGPLHYPDGSYLVPCTLHCG